MNVQIPYNIRKEKAHDRILQINYNKIMRKYTYTSLYSRADVQNV